MGIRLKYGCVTMLLMIITSISANGQSSVKKETARASLKKWGIAYCISQVYVSNTSVRNPAGNACSAYLELGSHTQDAYKVIEIYIKKYLKTKPYQSQFNKDLNLMKCLDLIENKVYNQKIIECDKWIITEKH